MSVRVNWFLSFMLICLVNVCQANTQVSFETPEQANAYQTLIKEIRCVTCPNQNIAETDGGIAKDIRAEIVARLTAGESLVDIRQYLIESYGEHITYRPLFNLKNAFLWCAPFLFVLLGLLYWRKSHATS